MDEQKLTITKDNVFAVCQREQKAGRVPRYTEIKYEFDRPHSLRVQRYWAEWTSENDEWVASQKGAKYGYKKLYEQTLAQKDALEDALADLQEYCDALNKAIKERFPDIPTLVEVEE